MAKSKKKPRRKARRIPLRLLASLLVSLAIVATIGYVLYRQQPVKTSPVITKTYKPVTQPKQPPLAKPLPPPIPIITQKPPVATTARFALVIDDMGYHKKIGDALLGLPLDLSFAFLPFAPYTESQLELARKQGRDILLHLPMEPTDNKWDPGVGALTVSMDRETIHRTVLHDLAAIPDAIGINNHMGSRFTEDEAAMRNFLGLLKKRNLFFLDSLTSSKSVGLKVAHKLGVLTMRRNVFLDNQQDKDIIKKQLDALAFLAKKQGIAIGIAHPHQATLAALRDYLQHHDKNVTLVSIRSLIKSIKTKDKSNRRR